MYRQIVKIMLKYSKHPLRSDSAAPAGFSGRHSSVCSLRTRTSALRTAGVRARSLCVSGCAELEHGLIGKMTPAYWSALCPRKGNSDDGARGFFGAAFPPCARCGRGHPRSGPRASAPADKPDGGCGQSVPATHARRWPQRRWRWFRFVTFTQNSPEGLRGNLGLVAAIPLGLFAYERDLISSPRDAASRRPRIPTGFRPKAQGLRGTSYPGSWSPQYRQPRRGCGRW